MTFIHWMYRRTLGARFERQYPASPKVSARLRRMSANTLLPALLLALPVLCTTALADDQARLSSGQTVYVSVYSNVFSGPKALPFELATMLSIRNTDLYNALKVTSVDYFDNDGKLLKKYLDKPLSLTPLASHHIYIRESGASGGFGANFIVRWEAAGEINVPIIESIMIGAKSGQGISFLSQGQVITEKNPGEPPAERARSQLTPPPLSLRLAAAVITPFIRARHP